jgi:hypothetical protein
MKLAAMPTAGDVFECPVADLFEAEAKRTAERR